MKKYLIAVTFVSLSAFAVSRLDVARAQRAADAASQIQHQAQAEVQDLRDQQNIDHDDEQISALASPSPSPSVSH